MTTAVLRRRTDPLHGIFVAACRATWAGAPLALAASIVSALALLPVGVTVVAAVPVPWVVLTLPCLVAITGAYRVWADLAVNGTTSWRELARVDPILALITWCLWIVIALLVGSSDPGVVAACVVGAVGALVLPLTFAYGAVRDRHGIAAVRGGLVLAARRPDLAVTLAAMTVIAGFAVVVSAGSLVLCAPALVAVFSCLAVEAELHRFDDVAPLNGAATSPTHAVEDQP